MLSKNNLKLYLDILILFFFVSNIFLFSIKFENFEVRYLILFLIFPCFYFIWQNLKYKNFIFARYIVYFSLFFLFHLLINIYLISQEINTQDILTIIYLLIIIIISYFYFEFINQNLKKLVIFFITLFILSSLINFFYFQYDAPYFCGGIPDFLNIMSEEVYKGGQNTTRSPSATRVSFKEFIFSENSHLGMVATGVIAFLVHLFLKQNLDFKEKIIFFTFFLICFVKSSTTFLLGTLSSFSIILILNYKQLYKKLIYSFIFIILFISSILIFNNECKSRFFLVDRDSLARDFESITSDRNFDTVENKHLNENKIINNKISDKISNYLNTFINNDKFLTKAVTFHAFSILKQSIIEKPFGWGINRYYKAFEYFNKKKPPKNQSLYDYNSKDGTNNFIKIFVEFGIFGLIFYIFIFLFIINKKIPIELKLFYVPLIITQSLRGAGYFNGGFILIAFLMAFTYINLYRKLK